MLKLLANKPVWRQLGTASEGGSVMVLHIIGAVITALIILGGLYLILRNITLFLTDALRGHPGSAWIDRPYLFRAIASTATLFWLFGPYRGANDALHLTGNQQQWVAFSLYLTAAAAWLWILRINFIKNIPADLLPQRTRQPGRLSWQGIGVIGYLAQLVLAAGVGALFAFGPGGAQSILVRLGVLVLLLASAFTSLWRISFVAAGPDHTFAQRLQHVVGGPTAGPPHAPPEATEE